MRLARFTGLRVIVGVLSCVSIVRAQQSSQGIPNSAEFFPKREFSRAAQDTSGTDTSPVVPVFEFHSGFWVNLHHFLYVEGRIRRAAGQSVTTHAQEQLPAPASVEALTPEQQRIWNAAVEAYAADWSSRDLLLNGDMVIVNNQLAQLENCADIAGKNRPECAAGLRSDLVAALESAAPIYRARWWPEQDRSNRAWIAQVAPLVRAMGENLGEGLAQVYQATWPAQPIRVDVVWSVGAVGAYTTLSPTHVTIASDDVRNQGPESLAILFHEASHALSTPLTEAIASECRLKGKPIPRDLWHAVLYYTADELTRRAYARRATSTTGSDLRSSPIPGAEPLYNSVWSQYRPLLETYWQPYLDKRISFNKAIEEMVSAL